jgi:hypothetical protein
MKPIQSCVGLGGSPSIASRAVRGVLDSVLVVVGRFISQKFPDDSEVSCGFEPIRIRQLASNARASKPRAPGGQPRVAILR